jgi:2,3-bisphosphoglycerate-dependent phosphoglycerate mutase
VSLASPPRLGQHQRVELVIVRHGRPESQQVTEGTADPGLAASGIAQARATGQFLAGEHIDAIVSSPMRRARETAQPLAEHLGIDPLIVPDLAEVDAHKTFYMPSEEYTPDHPFIMEMRDDPMSMFSHHGGFEAWRNKVVTAFDEVVAMHKGKTVAVFCHGMVTTTYLTAVLGHDDPFRLHPAYCAITRVTASSNGLRTAKSINETAHIRTLL